ncbi:radical SAM protein [Paenibacillus sp. M1]|uniref:Radical SAM protein n=1 Tax=Paenibacillus haidiansis TaxID=1574488 RepID=A0ABU7VS77_9BACL
MNSKNVEDLAKVLLINPPLWYYQSVPPDVTAAAALLHNNNIEFEIRDLNLESFHYLFRDHPEVVAQLTDNRYFYNFATLQQTYQRINQMYDRVNEYISPSVLRWNQFDSAIDLRDLSEVLSLATQRIGNPYFDFFNSLLPELVPADVRIVAISIYHPDQVVPLFTLTSLLKEHHPHLHIHIFGNLEDQINTRILVKNFPASDLQLLFSYVDSIGLDNDHYRLSELVQAVYRKSDLNELPSLFTERQLHPDFEIIKDHHYTDKLTLPVLSSIPASGLMPKDVLNVAASVSCYWKGCTYCSIKMHGEYQKDSIENILQMMESFSNQERFAVLRFRDCCISPGDLKRIANEIIRRKLIVSWSCRARLEKEFNPQLFELLKRAGCIMISFGIETFDPRVSQMMNKGIDLTYASVLIKSCYEAGIAVKLTAMVGFPTETIEESLANQEQLRSLFPYCIDIRYNRFILFENSRIALEPDHYSIQKHPFNDRQHLQFFCEFSRESGMTQAEADRIADDFDKKIREVYSLFLSEEHLLLYLKEFGLPSCMNLVNTETQQEKERRI